MSAWDAMVLGLGQAGLLYFAVTMVSYPYTYPGANLILGVIIVALLSIGWAGTYVLFTKAMPRAGGDYVWTSRAFHPAIGFAQNFTAMFAWGGMGLGILAQFFSNLYMAAALFVLGFSFHSAALIHVGVLISTNKGWEIGIGTLFLVVVTFIAIARMNVIKKFQTIMMILSMIGALLAVGVLVFTSHSSFIQGFNHSLQAVGDPGSYSQVIQTAGKYGIHPKGMWGEPATLGLTIAAIPTLMWLFTGFQTPAYVAGEVKNATKSMAIALGSVLLIGLVAFLLFVPITIHVAGADFWNSVSLLVNSHPNAYPWLSYVSPFIFAGMVNHSPVISILIAVGLFTAGFLQILPVYFVLGRAILAWSFDRVFPEWLARVNDRTHTPIYAMLLGGIVGEMGLILTVSVGLWAFWVSSTAVTAFAWLMVGIAAMLFPLRKQIYAQSGIQTYRFLGIPLIVWSGALMSIEMAVAFYWGLIPGTQLNVIWIKLGMLVLFFGGGLVIYYISRAIHRHAGLDIDLAFQEIPPE
ncbi:APC family permease [Alicyclobacillus tolerans]|uniref:APC family permease n=1 Tax=Alicyclobacillus tolerans TaxID=90970 RepID=UPI001F31C3EE|nr:APC family permease [Alicyclobacillus tolerans]MCF8565508.1 APC family permease [Alicyclobacillus tolerans]